MIIEETERILGPRATRYLETIVEKRQLIMRVKERQLAIEFAIIVILPYYLLGLVHDYLSFASLISIDVQADIIAELVKVLED